MQKKGNQDNRRTFGITKILSWSSVALIFASGLFMSIVIANYARDILLEKQQEFAKLLVENLNQQIYRRFTLPTILGVGYIALEEEEQFKRLDQVVRWSTHGLHMQELRVYGHEMVVSYSTDVSHVGRKDLAGESVRQALDGKASFQIISKVSPFWAIFRLGIQPGTVILRTIYPLRDESGGLRGNKEEKYIMGVLEVFQDITKDYETVIRFQWLIIATTLFTCMAMSVIMFMIIRRVDRMNAERQADKERMERELHQNEKLVSMGRMVASIAHEIRNPLGIIRSSAELLLSRAAGQDTLTSKILQAIFDEAKRLSQTVGDFLDYARPQQPKQNRVDLANVLDQALGFLESEFKKSGVVIERRFTPGLLVLGDKDLLYRAFYNIIINGVQALLGEDNGSARKAPMEDAQPCGTIVIEAEHKNDLIIVRFLDSGPGFDTEQMSKMLDPFFTTKDTGTGLGLAIVNNIVKNHQGGMDIDNNPDGGAIITFTFPALAV